MFEQTKIQKNKLLFPLLILSVWTTFGLFFGAQNYVRDIYVGKPASLPGYIVGWLVCGYAWAILTVPILRFVRRFSLERLGWTRFALTHLPAAIAFALGQIGLYVLISGTLFAPASRGYWEYYKLIIVPEFQSSFLVYLAIVSAVTAYDRWFRIAPDGYAAQASGKAELTSQVHPSLSQNGHATTFVSRIPVKENGRIVPVDVDNIDWIESYGNYVFLHTAERRYIVRETMAAIEKKLDPALFVRIRRSAIVRTARIKELRPMTNAEFDVVLAGGTILTSTRRYRKNLEPVFKG